MAKKVGIVLSGCGFLDGSEIHEATLTLLFLSQFGAEVVCMAPHMNHHGVVNHLSNEVTDDARNVLAESARIARGNIKDIKDIKGKDIDALIIPGGYGAAKNLCNFASKGVDCTVNPDVERLLSELHASKKPMGFICIAPVIAAKVLSQFNPLLTIGSDKDTVDAINTMGGRHCECTVSKIALDKKNKIVSTPAYMLGPSIASVAKGIQKLVFNVLELIHAKK